MEENQSIKFIEDAIDQEYPQLAVEAMFNQAKRDELKACLLKDYKKLSGKDVDDALAELVGLGIFEELIKDELITDIGWNGTDLWIKTSQKKYLYNGEENIDDKYIKKIIQRFANYAHQDFSDKNPILNAQLGNIRINAVHQSISPSGVTMSMRHARSKLVLTDENWPQFANPEVYKLFEDIFKIGANVVITGEVGTGKTELQKLLIGLIPDDYKIMMLEDTPETHIKEIYPEKDVYSWLIPESVSHTQMIKETMRNDPDYVILSEARDQAIYEIHQSVLTGHKIILTAHAQDAHAFPARMIGMSKQGFNVDEKMLLQEIYEYYNIGIHVKKRVINHKTIRYLQEVVEYSKNGLKTLYRQRLVQSKYGSEDYEFEESFAKLESSLVELTEEYGFKLRWNEKVAEIEKEATDEMD